MQFNAKALYIPISPYKLRPIADVVRGMNAYQALAWLSTCALKKVVPLQKVIKSAATNASYLHKVSLYNLYIKKISVDQGPIRRYSKPSAMGRAAMQRERKSHISVILESIKGMEEEV